MEILQRRYLDTVSPGSFALSLCSACEPPSIDTWAGETLPLIRYEKRLRRFETEQLLQQELQSKSPFLRAGIALGEEPSL